MNLDKIYKNLKEAKDEDQDKIIAGALAEMSEEELKDFLNEQKVETSELNSDELNEAAVELILKGFEALDEAKADKKEEDEKADDKKKEEKDEDEDGEDDDEDDADDDEDEKEMDEKKKKKMKESSEFFADILGKELSEETVVKCNTLFEAAVQEKVLAEKEALQEKFETETSEYKETLLEQADSYMTVMAEEYITENELAIKSNLKADLVEDFMQGLKELFLENYVDIPEEKVEIVEELAEKVESLEASLDESINKISTLQKELSEKSQNEVFESVASDLADTEKEKLKNLSEGIKFESEDSYTLKLETIKEKYFPKEDVKEKDVVLNEDKKEDSKKVAVNSDITNAVKFISNSVKK